MAADWTTRGGPPVLHSDGGRKIPEQSGLSAVTLKRASWEFGDKGIPEAERFYVIERINGIEPEKQAGGTLEKIKEKLREQGLMPASILILDEDTARTIHAENDKLTDVTPVAKQGGNRMAGFDIVERYKKLQPQEKFFLYAWAASAVGFLLPWFSIPIVGSINGMNISLFIGSDLFLLVLLAGVLMFLQKKKYAVIVSFVAAAGLLAKLVQFNQLNQGGEEALFGITLSSFIGLGAYLSYLGAAVMVYFAVTFVRQGVFKEPIISIVASGTGPTGPPRTP